MKKKVTPKKAVKNETPKKVGIRGSLRRVDLSLTMKQFKKVEKLAKKMKTSKNEIIRQMVEAYVVQQ